MIDYINATIEQVGIIKQWENNCQLEFTTSKTKNGFLKEAKYKNMLFRVFQPSGIASIKGSLHYLFNDGKQNWNDFKRLDLFDTVHTFCNKFGIQPDKAICHSFEFGVNIVVPFNPSLLIESILAYKTGVIIHDTDHKNKKDIVYISFGQYKLKIYNKGEQFGQHNILRFEINILKMAKVSAIPQLKTLNDLLKIPVLITLGKFLQSEFDGLIISEPLMSDHLSKKDLEIFDKMNNRMYWKIFKSKQERSRAKTKFKQIIAQSGNGMHRQTSILINKKWQELLEVNQKNDTFLHGVQIVTPKDGNSFLLPFNHLDNRLKGIIIPKEKKRVQKRCSSCRKLLKKIESSYCNDDCKTQKMIRNKRSNSNHKVKQKINILYSQPTLFKQSEFIKIESAQIMWLEQKGVYINM